MAPSLRGVFEELILRHWRPSGIHRGLPRQGKRFLGLVCLAYLKIHRHSRCTAWADCQNFAEITGNCCGDCPQAEKVVSSTSQVLDKPFHCPALVDLHILLTVTAVCHLKLEHHIGFHISILFNCPLQGDLSVVHAAASQRGCPHPRVWMPVGVRLTFRE